MNEDVSETKTAGLTLMFNHCRPAEAVEKYTGDVYIQHNPSVGDGNQVPRILTRMDRSSASASFKRVIAEGNFVVLHCLQEWPGDSDWAGIDIFRLHDNGKIVEHWDVLQQVSKSSANDNTMF